MTTYDLYNPTRTPRILYDGIEGSQRQLRLDPGGRLIGISLGQHVVDMLRSRTNDIQVFERGGLEKVVVPVPPPVTSARKPSLIVTGMWGIGDNIHQRAIIRELMKRNDVWLEGTQFAPFHDLISDGLKFIRRGASPRIGESTHRPSFSQPPRNSERMRIGYQPADIIRTGSIMAAQFRSVGMKVPEKPDFSLPVPEAWREKAKKLLPEDHKPLLVYRPITLNRSWHCEARSPDPPTYNTLYKSIRDKFYVVSVADLRTGHDWIVGDKADVDLELHNGSLDFETMAGLFAEAKMVFANPGFSPVLAQAVRTPVVVVYGGNECYQTSNQAGAHLAHTLAIEPATPCKCHNCGCPNAGKCKKSIDMPKALEKVLKFASYCERPKSKVLIFATTYVDTDERKGLTEKWVALNKHLNPDCDLLLVDSKSPTGLPEGVDVWSFDDNVGHLSRNGPRGPTSKGRDGWGRAFCRGLEIAAERGYDYVAHIEGDSLFRLPLRPIIDEMVEGKIDAISTPVAGTKNNMPHWIETGLIIFRTGFIAESGFVAKYDWQNRKEVPSPEAVIKTMLGDKLKLMPWKALRGDKNQLAVGNVPQLDWVTHCKPEIYDAFFKEVMPTAAGIFDPGISNNTATLPQLKLNLGCGTNKLEGWENHDADVDISKKLPYGDNNADFIFCEHCVEHVPYVDAVAFFAECRRVLKPGGVVRITVPSIEQIYKYSTPDYIKFTTKFQPENSLRGALANIMFKHGHQTCWTAALLEATLYYAGFEDLKQCAPGASGHHELRGVEGHSKVIGEAFNAIESICFEGTKPAKRIAVVVGGGRDVWDEVEKAKALCGDRADYFVVNDMIAQFPGECVAVTLHPSKLGGWLKNRKGPRPKAVWSHRPHDGVTDHVEDWQGSSGLFAAGPVAIKKGGYDRVLLCGVPMSSKGGHFVRGIDWVSSAAFLRGWERHRDEIAPYVRSFSGWTAEQFGRPSEEFVS